jgi:hypothetical protein
VRDYVGDIEAAVTAAARGVLDQGLATLTRTESGAKLLPRSLSACSLEIAELYGFPRARPPARGARSLSREERLAVPEWHFASPDHEALRRALARVSQRLRIQVCASCPRRPGALRLSEGVETYIGFNQRGRAATAKDPDTTPLWALRALTHCAAA